jgi:hypothetical protein
MRITYDPKCEELARYFLTSETSVPDNDQVNRLAGVIQAAIEEFLSHEYQDADQEAR